MTNLKVVSFVMTGARRVGLAVLLTFAVGLGSRPLQAQNPPPPAPPAPAPVSPAPVSPTPSAPTGKATVDSAMFEYIKNLQERDKEYQEFIKSQTEKHQTFLETTYGRIVQIATWIGALAVVLFGGIMGWLNWRTQKDIRAAIDNDMKYHMKERIVQVADEIKVQMEGNVTKEMAAILKECRGRLNDLQSQLETRSFRDNEIQAAVTESLLVLQPDYEGKSSAQQQRLAALHKKLSFLLGKYPHSRSLAIQLARQFRHRLGDLLRAIEILKHTIDMRRDDKIAPDPDDAALYYNLACYLNARAMEEERKPTPERYKIDSIRQQAKEALSEAIAHDPVNRQEAEQDEDLIGLDMSNLPPAKTKAAAPSAAAS